MKQPLMVNNPFFSAWVANTVADCMGNFEQCHGGLQRKLAPTLAGSCASACQGVFELYFIDKNAGSAGSFAVATTNNGVYH